MLATLLMLPLADATALQAWAIEFPDRTERFAIERAHYSTYDDNGQQALTVRIDTGALLSPLPPREGLPKPFWELTVLLPEGETFSMAPGATWTIPAGFDEARDEYVVDWYYGEHEISDDNRITVIAVNGTDLELEVTGTAWLYGLEDKPARMPLKVRAWFRWDRWARRSGT